MGRQMAAQNNVTKNAQRDVEEQGAFREYIGRPMPANAAIVLITAAW